MRQLVFKSILREAKKANDEAIKEALKKEFCHNQTLLINNRSKISHHQRLALYKRQVYILEHVKERD